MTLRAGTIRRWRVGRVNGSAGGGSAGDLPSGNVHAFPIASGGSNVEWDFDDAEFNPFHYPPETTSLGVEAFANLKVNGESPTSIITFDAANSAWVILGYPSPVAVGDPYSVAGPIPVEFVEGDTLFYPESGFVF